MKVEIFDKNGNEIFSSDNILNINVDRWQEINTWTQKNQSHSFLFSVWDEIIISKSDKYNKTRNDDIIDKLQEFLDGLKRDQDD